MKPRTVSCPVCKKPVAWTPAAKFRPFCSERCKTNDLGAWASEQYRVAGEPLLDPPAAIPDDEAPAQ
jgi:endogenous inhibitor of DNA gyrase (YacG/DUF329 family)